MAQQIVSVYFIALFAVVAGSSIHDHGRNFLGAAMQPETVAKTLLAVEDEWKDQAASYLKCEVSKSKDEESDCDFVSAKFTKSCETVVSAIVKGSDGDTEVTKEYMVDVCSQPSMTKWRRDTCITLAKDVAGTMTASAYENRANFHAKQACDGFWFHFLDGQKAINQKALDALKAEEADKKKKEDEEMAEQAKALKEEDEQQKTKEDIKEEIKRHVAAAKAAKFEKLREALNATEEKTEVDAVEAAADEKLKETPEEPKETKDPKLANETPEMQKAYAVLEAADAMTGDKDAVSSEHTIENKTPEKVTKTDSASNVTSSSTAEKHTNQTKTA